MLLSITHTGEHAQDIGFLFRKNPARPQVFALNYGKAHVFYPEVSEHRTTLSLLLDIDPIELSRGKAGAREGGLFDYVNDRPYVSSSFLSTAISRVFGAAMSGRCDTHQALADARLDLSAEIVMLPCRGDTAMLNRVFEPLGYAVAFETFCADEAFPAWGDSRYVNLTLKGALRLQDLLHHLYVLIPVFDRQKHYWIGRAEVEKLLRHGETWLKTHPEKEFIARRYLSKNRALANLALQRLQAEDEVCEPDDAASEPAEAEKETKPGLNQQRLGSVLAAVRATQAASVIDFGCGEGRLLALLMREAQLKKIAAVDVAFETLERARDRIRYERLSETQKQRLSLFQGSLAYRDKRFEGFDAACVIEVIEHLDLPRLAAFERVLFAHARPGHVILTTPNREYNEKYALEGLRHSDHRFEWTRQEFRAWAQGVAERHDYRVSFSEIGERDEMLGAPTQMALFILRPADAVNAGIQDEPNAH
ncbi:MAG: 3' terminal RNA ribose 2'-O-methyltransferase Hen1 [Zoogloeaceae bacterium]|jgi:3' terminal RNA ribose 2'-O-methyltransferase Hen1|nr:3' terminal RNA ribose 2'-O-methyltransferase Hen1 [Zoogloeaceae bacterium]